MEKKRVPAPTLAVGILVVALFFLYLPIFYLVGGSFIDKTSGVYGLSLRW